MNSVTTMITNPNMILAIMHLTMMSDMICMTEGLNVLLLPAPAPSHLSYFLEVGNELIDRGHKVGVLIPVYFKEKIPTRFSLNGSNVILDEIAEKANEEKMQAEVRKMMEQENVDMMTFMMSQAKLMSEKMEKLLGNQDIYQAVEDNKYDIAIVDGMPFTKGLYVIPYRHGIPFTTLTTGFFPTDIGVPYLPSFMPSMLSTNTPEMNFFQRVQEVAFAIGVSTMKWPKTDESYVRDFAPGKDIIDLNTLYQKSEMWFVNSDVLLDYIHPTTPNMIECGGLTTKPSKPLPTDLDDFISNSKNGIIVVSFGSMVSKFTDRIVAKLVETFKQVDVDIIWRYAGENKEVPKNVKTVAWLPQNDLLGHPKTRLFITHCGNNGQTEALYHGVPMIGLPIFGDQPYNAKRMAYKGYGIAMDLKTFEVDELVENINIILQDKGFTDRIKKASKIFRSRSRNPKQRVVDTLEHVDEFGGEYLRPHSLDMSLYKLYLIDVMATVFVTLLVLFCIFFKLLFCGIGFIMFFDFMLHKHVGVLIPVYFKEKIPTRFNLNGSNVILDEIAEKANEEKMQAEVRKMMEQENVDMMTFMMSQAKLMSEKMEKLLGNQDIYQAVEDNKYDIAIVDGMPFTKGLYVIPYRHGIPFTTLTTGFFPTDIGVPYLPSFMPSMLSTNTPEMNFFQRVQEVAFAIGVSTMKWPKTDESYVRDFAPGKAIIDLNTLYQKSEMWFVNSDVLLDYIHPTTPNMIECGGLTTKPSKPLPTDLDDFISNSKNGIIVVSFGSMVSKFTNRIVAKLVETFKQVDVDIIWRYAGENKEVPKNVKTVAWLPQNDLLGHPKTRLFITHCGNNGQTEALYHGVPMIGLPIFGDQPYNAKRMAYKGYGIAMDLKTFEVDELVENINIILQDKGFTDRIKKASKIFRSRSRNPKQRVVDTLEHVDEFGGEYLRPHSLDMSLYKLYLIDVMATVFVTLLVLFCIFFKLLFCGIGFIMFFDFMLHKHVGVLIPVYFKEKIPTRFNLNGSNVILDEIAEKANEEKMQAEVRKMMEQENVDMMTFMMSQAKLMSEKMEKLLGNQDIYQAVEDNKYDIAIVDGMPFTKGLYVIPYRHGIPFTTLTTGFFPTDIGVPYLPSFMPSMLSTNTPEMNFFQRVQEVAFAIGVSTMKWPKTDESYVRDFAPGKAIIDLNTLYQKSEMWFVNSDVLLDYIHPTTPNMIECGGLTTKPSKPLPTDLDDFISNSKNGIIVVSFGSMVSKFTNRIVAKLVETFKQVDVDIIWRYAGENKEVPKNVKTVAWLPQNDLLGHPKTRLFITHCGNNGQTEALYHGVPMIGLPIFGDQPYNAKRMAYKGYGIAMDLKTFEVDELVENINIILQDKGFTDRIKKASKIFRSRSRNPKQRVVDTLEHVDEFGGEYLRPHSLDMSLYKLYLIDVMATVFVTLLVLFCIFFKLLFCGIGFISKSKKLKSQ
ncbi:unnamed protein product [Owenia fusiformis]|uniref:Glucuronosyltransferase n=1 Tax=Owenia fusiformis TaxID=6347 RepID=A0A8S4PNI1_OWEFU|nr:unnamed protein product [Owenia fusiformis]